MDAKFVGYRKKWGPYNIPTFISVLCVLLCLLYFVLSLQWFSLFQFNNNTIWNCKNKNYVSLSCLCRIVYCHCNSCNEGYTRISVCFYHHHNHHFKCLCEHCRILKLRLKIFSMRIVILVKMFIAQSSFRAFIMAIYYLVAHSSFG